jgi:hypothetical protein
MIKQKRSGPPWLAATLLQHKEYSTVENERANNTICYDILESMRSVYDATNDESIAATAASLIETEEDPKYRKKYLTLWRKKK